MKISPSATLAPRLVLSARTAAELMTPNPRSIEADLLVNEAAAFFADRGFSAAAVIDAAGRPIGVLSQSDLVTHDREKGEFTSADQNEDAPDFPSDRAPAGFGVVNVDRTRVREIMTPVIFAVTPDTPVFEVVEGLLAHKIHRLFVVDRDGTPIGIISTTDVLRHLHQEEAPRSRV